MNQNEARAAILSGARFGDVYELLGPADGAELGAWFVHELEPTAAIRARWNAARASVARAESETPLREISGRAKREHLPTGYPRDERIGDEPCHRCGSQRFIQSGSCRTCAECGESGGCA